MSKLKQKPVVNQNGLEEVYEIREKIGDGHFADVNRCICKRSKQYFAAKFIMKQRFSNSTICADGPQGTNVTDIDREAYILANLEHENIVKLHEVFYRDDSVVLILDLVTGGELFARVAECERLSEEEASNFVEQILLGVKHMHDLGVVHLDLKPENIMIEDLASRKIKIIDFGLARVLHPNQTFQDMAGTPEFCAPEIVNYDPITFATDMWAIGVITYILLTGISPFAGDSQLETFQNILDCIVDYQREEIRDTTDLAKDFIRRLLMKNPRKRFTANECLMHAWIKPCDSAQKDSRRDSVIRRQNLNGLRNFIAYPSPPSSPNAVPLTLNDKSGNHFFESVVPAQPEEETVEADPETELSPDPVVLEVQETERRSSVKLQAVEHATVSIEQPISVIHNSSTQQQNTSTVHQVTTIKSFETPSDLPSRRVRNSEPLVKVHCKPEGNSNNRRPTEPPANPAVVEKSGWKVNFGSSFIGRLGAAFAAATMHSTTQVSSAIKSYTNNSTSYMESTTVVHETDSISHNATGSFHELGSTDSTHPPNENLQASNINAMKFNPFTRQPNREPNERKVPRNPVRRGLQLGNVSRAVQEFESSVSNSTDSEDLISSSTHDQNRVQKQRQHKSHSIAQGAEVKVWNAHQHTKNASKNQQPREPVRAQVGRLQELFERRASGPQARMNGGAFSHRASHS